MSIFDIFVNKSKQNNSFEPDYDKLSPDEVELEFKIRQNNIKRHSGSRLEEDLRIISLLAKKYKHIPAIHFCLDNFEDTEEYERIGAELGDAVCLYRYYSLERIKDMKPHEAEKCIGLAVRAGVSSAYLTLGDYYAISGNTDRALDIYKLAHSLSVKGAIDKIAGIDPHLAERLSESVTTKAIKTSSLAARLKGEKQ